MNNFLNIIFLAAIIIVSVGCGGGSSSSTRNDDLTIGGTFTGKDSADRDATVIVNNTATPNTIGVNLKSATEDIDFSGEIILTAMASSGKKLATGDIAYDVNLKITSSNLTGFSVDGISLGRIIKKVDAEGTTLYTCAFNFTSNSVRSTDSTDSDWSMSGTKSTATP